MGSSTQYFYLFLARERCSLSCSSCTCSPPVAKGGENEVRMYKNKVAGSFNLYLQRVPQSLTTHKTKMVLWQNTNLHYQSLPHARLGCFVCAICQTAGAEARWARQSIKYSREWTLGSDSNTQLSNPTLTEILFISMVAGWGHHHFLRRSTSEGIVKHTTYVFLGQWMVFFSPPLSRIPFNLREFSLCILISTKYLLRSTFIQWLSYFCDFI